MQGDRLDVAASSMSAPPSSLVISRVSGPALISAELHWTSSIEAGSVEATGPRIGAVGWRVTVTTSA